MTTATPPCTAYVGSLEDIPSTASPGLLFLKTLLPLIDDTTTDTQEIRAKLHSPSAVFINNAAAPVYADAKKNAEVASAPGTKPVLSQPAKAAKRNAALKCVNREFRRAWDIDNGNGRRTVIHESRNYMVFAADPENPVLMPEAGIIELARIPAAVEGAEDGEFGVAGFWAIETRSWHDRVGMLKKREELGC
jgi:hypothetical protein